MVGGEVINVVVTSERVHVEVLDTRNFDRCWRDCRSTEPRPGDSLWWQSWKGYLSREGEFSDKCIGRCAPGDAPSQLDDASVE